MKEKLHEDAFAIITSTEKEFADWIERVRWQSKRCDELAWELKRIKDKQEQGLLIEKSELERYKLALFGVIRNSKVMPVGLTQGRSMEEINAMSLKTMEEVLKMVDCDAMGRHYSEAEEALAKMGGIHE